MKSLAILGLCVCGAFIAVSVTTIGCTQPETAKRVLKQQGYTEVEVTGWRPWMADKNDTFSTGFKAKSPSGDTVTGAVTGGWLKGNTIRLD